MASKTVSPKGEGYPARAARRFLKGTRRPRKLPTTRKISGQAPVKGIALTGYGGPREQQLATKAAFTNRLMKPVGGDKLVQTIESLFAD
jgi:hypothetical protein